MQIHLATCHVVGCTTPPRAILQSIAKGLARVRNFRIQAKNQKIISSNDEKCFFFQTENYDVFDIDEMLIIS